MYYFTNENPESQRLWGIRPLHTLLTSWAEIQTQVCQTPKRRCFPSSLALITSTLHFREPTLLFKNLFFQITIHPFSIRQKWIQISVSTSSLVSQDFLYTGKAIWWNTCNFSLPLLLFSSPGIFFCFYIIKSYVFLMIQLKCYSFHRVFSNTLR